MVYIKADLSNTQHSLKETLCMNTGVIICRIVISCRMQHASSSHQQCSRITARTQTQKGTIARDPALHFKTLFPTFSYSLYSYSKFGSVCVSVMSGMSTFAWTSVLSLCLFRLLSSAMVHHICNYLPPVRDFVSMLSRSSPFDDIAWLGCLATICFLR